MEHLILTLNFGDDHSIVLITVKHKDNAFEHVYKAPVGLPIGAARSEAAAAYLKELTAWARFITEVAADHE